MSIIIALVIVLTVGALVANFYPGPNSNPPLAQGEILTPDSEVEAPVVEEPAHIDPPAITTAPSDQAAAKMSAKPKKKYYHNNKKPKTTK
jgi:hypothetical protein